MISTYRKFLALLRPDERRRFWWLLGLVTLSGLLETISIGAILPFLSLLSDPSLIEAKPKLHWIYTLLGFDSARNFQIFVGIFTLSVVICGLMISAGTFYLVNRFANMRSFTLSSRLLQGHLHQPYVTLLRRNSADIRKSVLQEVNRLVGSSIRPAMQLTSYVVLAVLVTGMLIWVAPLAALLTAGVMGVIYLTLYLTVRKVLVRLGHETMLSNKARFRITQEATGGIKDVKLMGLEDTYVRLFNTPSRLVASNASRTAVIAQMPRYLLQGFAFLSVVVFLLIMLIRNDTGWQEVLPTVGLFVFAGLRLLPALQTIYMTMAALRNSTPLLNQVNREMTRVLSNSAEWRRGPPPAPLPLNTGISLRGLEFSYPQSDRKVLNGIDLTIPARSSLGIVGGTGAGKTTLVDILLGLLTPDAGEVLIDGRPLDPGTLWAWQRNIGYVPQHIYLTDDTIRANIAFGVPKAEIDDVAVERAARLAALHDFVLRDLEEGYDTVVGDRGARLSGGQRQRVGIARALYRDPDVLVLDEATSALDNLTERVVMDAVESLGRIKTVILIAHRLTTVEACDKIVLMDGGQVAAEGSYAELLANNPAFRAMVARDPAAAAS